MGGYGSGRWCSQGSKTTTESQHRIDIRWLKKQGFLQPGAAGSLSWSRGGTQTGSIGYRMEVGKMILRYRYSFNKGKPERVEQSITLDQTPCHYGGQRQWFLCPKCRRRVAVLYGTGKYFFCRLCCGLAYTCQQEGKIDRLIRKARKIRQRLEADSNLFMPIWNKPKNMHWKTFDRLRRAADCAHDLSCGIMAQRLGLEADLHREAEFFPKAAKDNYSDF